jgi:molybdopterin-biosynthesis enzyme MoeA-like protein
MEHGRVALVCLPGVPAEMKDIFESGVRPVLAQRLGDGCSVQWQAVVACGDESMLSPILRKVAAEHPEAYIKSRAGLFGPDARFRITLSARGSSGDSVAETVSHAWGALQHLLEEAGISVLSWERIR